MLLALCNSFVTLSKATLVYFAIERAIAYILSVTIYSCPSISDLPIL